VSGEECGEQAEQEAELELGAREIAGIGLLRSRRRAAPQGGGDERRVGDCLEDSVSHLGELVSSRWQIVSVVARRQRAMCEQSASELGRHCAEDAHA